MYLSAHKATKKLGILSDTLCCWLKQERITAKTSPSGTCLYNIPFIFPELTSQNADNTTTATSAASAATKKGFLYARSQVSSKKKTLNGRNNSSAPDFQPMNSSVTSGQESTSNAKDCK